MVRKEKWLGRTIFPLDGNDKSLIFILVAVLINYFYRIQKCGLRLISHSCMNLNDRYLGEKRSCCC